MQEVLFKILYFREDFKKKSFEVAQIIFILTK